MHQRSLAIISAEHTFAFVFFAKAFQESTSLLCYSAFCTFDSTAWQLRESHPLDSKAPTEMQPQPPMEVPQNGYQVRCFTIQCFNFDFFQLLSLALPFTFLPHGAISCMMTPLKLLSAQEKGRGARGRGGQQKNPSTIHICTTTKIIMVTRRSHFCNLCAIS